MLVATCPSREELIDYAVGRLSDEAADALASHIEDCPSCQAELAALPEPEDALIARLREPLSSDPYLDEPGCGEAVALARAVVQREASATDLPRQLGEYQLMERLGSGGMGTVYKARQGRLDRIVALKILGRGRTDDPRAIVRFEREMKAIGRLDHAHIVRAYDAREIDGTLVLVMEFVDGLDLAEIVRRTIQARSASEAGIEARSASEDSDSSHSLARRACVDSVRRAIAVPDACELVRQTALALQCAHEHALVHRDVKPSNIMLARSGEVKLLDLGLARFFAEGGADVSSGIEETTSTGQAMGTADYMAPEQASDSRAVDIRADIYSLGCTLYKLLTGRAPFSGPEYCTSLDKLNAHVSAVPPPVRGLAPAVPEGLAAIIDRMLAKNPADRFATPAEVVDTLVPFCTGADLRALLKRAETTPPSPAAGGAGGEGGEGLGEGGNRPSTSGKGAGGEGGAKRERDNLPSPFGRGAGGEGASGSRRWKWLVGQLLLLALVGGLGYTAAIILRIHKDGKTTTFKFEDGSDVAVSGNGEIDVKSPAGAGVAAAAKTPTRFRLATVTRGDLTATISATGTIGPEQVVDVTAQVEGPILKLGDDPRGKTDPTYKGKTVDFNTPVDAGTVLAEIDPTVYKTRRDEAAADVEHAKAEVAAAYSKISNTRDGGAKGIALAAATAAKAGVTKPKIALELAQTNLDRTVIRSPVKGTIIDRRVNVGQNVTPTSGSLFLIAKDLDKLQILASVNEVDIGRIAKGMDVRFRVDTLPDEVFSGKVAQIRMNATMVQNVVCYTVVVAIDKPDRRLMPYMTANVNFQVETRRNVLLVPNAALRWKARPDQVVPEARTFYPAANQRRSDWLFVPAEDEAHVRPVEVKVEMTDGTLSVVSGQGIWEGMWVVTGELVGDAEGSAGAGVPALAGGYQLPPGVGTSTPAKAGIPARVAAVRPSILPLPDYLETTGKIIAELAANGAAGPGKLLRFEIDQATFTKMMQAAQKRLAHHAKPAARDGRARPEPSGIDWAAILHINYGYVAAGERDFPHRAEVMSLAEHFDPNVGGATCTATIDKSDTRAAPGLPVLVRLDTGATHESLAVLRQAIFTDLGRKFVYVVNVGNVVEPRAVEVGPSQGGPLSQVMGLNRNDIVIVDPSAVKPGMAVKADFIAGALQLPTPPIEFAECPLKDVVDYLRDALHIQIQIDTRGLAAASVSPDVQCTFNIHDVSFASALRLLLRSVGLTYVAEDEYILITAPGKEPGANVPKADTDNRHGSSPGRAASEDRAKAGAAAPLPVVRVTQPVVCDVCDYEEYTGRIEQGIVSIHIPFGEFEKAYFKEGMTVREGDLLGEVVPNNDPKVNQAQQAVYDAEHARIEAINVNDKKRMKKTEAELKAARDELERANRNMPRVKVFAPISGKLGFEVMGRSGVLGFGGGGFGGGGGSGPPFRSIISPDSMIVTFDVPERAVLAHRRMTGRKPGWELSLPVVCALADDKGFPYRGKVVTVAQGIDPSTHTQRWQALVKNQDGIFMPGMSVRLRLITSEPHKVMLIPHGTEFGGLSSENEGLRTAEIYIVNERNKIESRKVKLARGYDDYFPVQDGLNANDWVVLERSGNRTSGHGFWIIKEKSGTLVAPEKVTTPPPAWAAISVPPTVSVAHPVVREVTDYVENSGQLVAAQTAEIRARVSGNLDKVCFKPGALVKKGDVLFEIDPRLYQAELDRAASTVKEAEVRFNARSVELDRVQALAKSKAVSQEEIDQAKSQRDEAAAAVHTAEAALNVAQVHFDYTHITAPFDGKIGGSLVDAANLVSAEQTALATLMSTDPICVHLWVDEQTLSAIRRRAKEHDEANPLKVTCKLGSSNDDDSKPFIYEGRLDSVESVVHANGQIGCRAVLPNKDGGLLPGRQVRVRLAISAPHKGLLVPKSWLRWDKGSFVLVVTGQNVVERRDVEFWRYPYDGLWAVTKGLTADDWIVTSDLKQLRPGMAVTPQKTAIPSKP